MELKKLLSKYGMNVTEYMAGDDKVYIGIENVGLCYYFMLKKGIIDSKNEGAILKHVAQAYYEEVERKLKALIWVTGQEEYKKERGAIYKATINYLNMVKERLTLDYPNSK